MVFEDLQWADAALVEFLEYLLEWSRSFPIFVLTLARPELLERRSALGRGHAAASRRCPSSRCPTQRSRSCSGARPRAAPTRPRAQIRDRADGVPLYAVETVRMLLDRGLLERRGVGVPRRSARSRRSTCPRRSTR